MRATTLVPIFAAFALFVAAPAPVRAQDEDRAKMQKEYRLGDDADEAARATSATAWKLDFSTPENAFRSWQAACVRGSKADFLACLEPEFRKQRYPDGENAKVKQVESLKYHYLIMYAKLDKVETSGDEGFLYVTFTMLRGGTPTKQPQRFKIKRVDGRWLFASL